MMTTPTSMRRAIVGILLGAAAWAAAPGATPVRASAAAPAVSGCPANAKTANLNFSMKDTEGRTVNLATYKGKVLLLDFWATWCIPCKVEIPAFTDLYRDYKAKGLEVVGVVAMDEFTKAKPFALQFKINYPVLNGVDRDDIDDAFGPLFALPTTLLIARDGRVCARHIGLPTPASIKDPTVADVKNALETQIKQLL